MRFLTIVLIATRRAGARLYGEQRMRQSRQPFGMQQGVSQYNRCEACAEEDCLVAHRRSQCRFCGSVSIQPVHQPVDEVCGCYFTLPLRTEMADEDAFYGRNDCDDRRVPTSPVSTRRHNTPTGRTARGIRHCLGPTGRDDRPGGRSAGRRIGRAPGRVVRGRPADYTNDDEYRRVFPRCEFARRNLPGRCRRPDGGGAGVACRYGAPGGAARNAPGGRRRRVSRPAERWLLDDAIPRQSDHDNRCGGNGSCRAGRGPQLTAIAGQSLTTAGVGGKDPQ